MVINSDAVRGRVKYIDPTNLMYKSDGTVEIVPSNTLINNNHEDFAIAVDLQVQIPNRKSCGLAKENNDYVIMNFSSTNGTISFMHGTNGELTTNFTDVSMTNPSKNTNECLGIESISIEYNSWQYPQVTIKFVDVRGASVMLPEESSMMDNTSMGSIYRALFSLPSPTFRLKVKGFYGMGVTYYLAEEKIDINLDAASGNFEITAKFIGQMYRIYTDIPMTYICVAPYMNGGKEYWDAQVKNKTFRFLNSNGGYTDMITFPELREKIAIAALSDERKSAAAAGKLVMSNTEERVGKLNVIRDTYPLKDWKFIEGKGYYYATADNITVNSIVEKIDNFIDEVSKYDEAYKTNYISQFSGLREYGKKSKTGKKSSVIEEIVYTPSESGIKISEPKKSNANVEEVEEAKEYITQYIGSHKESIVRLFYLANNLLTERMFITEGIENAINRCNDEAAKVKSEYDMLEKSLLEEALGFTPSIANIYDLAFAHMDTFMHVIFENLKSIKKKLDGNEIERTLSYFGNMESDIRDGETQVPPYPAFYREVSDGKAGRRRELQWPENIPNGGKLDEVDFIKNLINASSLYGDEAAEVEERIRKMTMRQSEGENGGGNRRTGGVGGSDGLIGCPSITVTKMIPLTTYDFVNKDRQENPYMWIKRADEAGTLNDGESFEMATLATFALRCLYYLHVNNNGSREASAFGKIEALNFIKAFGDKYCTDKFFNFLDMYADGKARKREAKNVVNTLTSKIQNNTVWDFGTGKLLERGTITGNLTLGLSPYCQAVYPIGEPSLVAIKKASGSASGDPEKFFPQNKDVDWPAESFFIFKARDYVNEIYKSAEEFVGDENYGIKRSDISNYENNIDAILDRNSDQTYVNSCIYSVGEDKPINGTTLIDLFNKSFEEQSKYYIKHPTMINAKRGNSLFDEDYYNWQGPRTGDATATRARAYLFLSALPLKGKEGRHNSSRTGTDVYSLNGVELKSTILREGSFYWRRKMMENGGEDPIKMGTKYLAPESGQTFMTDEFKIFEGGTNKECLHPIEKGLFKGGNDYKSSYIDFVEPIGCTESRRRVIMKYFTDWADNEFGRYETDMTNKEFYVGNDFNKGFDYNSLSDGSSEIKKKRAKDVQAFLRSTFFGAVTVFDYYAMSDKSEARNEPKKFTANADRLRDAFVGFMKILEDAYKERVRSGQESMEMDVEARKANDPFNNEDLRLATYMTVKGMYDKWLCAPLNGQNTFKFGSPESDFSKFTYIDSFYHNIGRDLNVNITKVGEWISTCLPTQNIQTNEGLMKYNGRSLYEFLADVAQHTGGMLFAFPHRIGMYGVNYMTEMFKAIPEIGNWDTDESSFVFVYTYKPSEHLGNDMYEDDGIDFAIKPEQVTNLFSEDGKSYDVPAFGVTYAKQNQSYFKNITLTTENPATTEASITATLAIAAKGSEGARETNLFGQDLYRIKSSYSYSCDFDMMGCMQVSPLMYFNLNNVPFWRGAYMIYKVTHQITNGDVTTHVSGMRINRYSVPIVSSDVIGMNKRVNGNNAVASGGGSEGGVSSTSTSTSSGEAGISVNESGNPYAKVGNAIDFVEDNITEEKPIICITPAHGPKTEKRPEWSWSSRLVDEYIIPELKKYRFWDGTSYANNIQRCNKYIRETDKAEGTGKYYSLKEVQHLITKYGSNKVISVVPHWNGGAGDYYAIFDGYKDEGGATHRRKDSILFREYFIAECKKWIEKVKNGELKCIPKGMLNRVAENFHLLDKGKGKSDGAVQLNCPCILTENLFADYSSVKGDSAPMPRPVWDEEAGWYRFPSGKWSQTDGDVYKYGYGWLNSDEGLKVIARIHVKAIVNYIKSREKMSVERSKEDLKVPKSEIDKYTLGGPKYDPDGNADWRM